MAEPNPSNPHTSTPNHTAEPFVLQINPSSEPPSNQNLNRTTTTTMSTDPSMLPPPSPSIMSTTQENHHLQVNQSHHMISMNNNEPPYTSSTSSEPPSTPSTSIALPHQYHHGLLNTLFEQFVSHIVRQSTPPQQQLSTPSGSFNFKVEPILLHINSSVPLPNQPPNDVVTPPPPTPPQPQPQRAAAGGEENYRKHQKALKNAGSLANLLPTGTVLAFQALTPTLSQTGKCHLTNKVLIGGVVIVCTIICFCSSFTDSLCYNGKVYYGIASRKGLLVFNYDNREQEEANVEKATKDLKLQPKDFVHAFFSAAVFLIFAFSSSQLQGCFFPTESKQTHYSMVAFFPLVTGILSSFLFTIFPTKRKGIGYTP